MYARGRDAPVVLSVLLMMVAMAAGGVGGCSLDEATADLVSIGADKNP